jgi:hypothetical protein
MNACCLKSLHSVSSSFFFVFFFLLLLLLLLLLARPSILRPAPVLHRYFSLSLSLSPLLLRVLTQKEKEDSGGLPSCVLLDLHVTTTKVGSSDLRVMRMDGWMSAFPNPSPSSSFVFFVFTHALSPMTHTHTYIHTYTD